MRPTVSAWPVCVHHHADPPDQPGNRDFMLCFVSFCYCWSQEHGAIFAIPAQTQAFWEDVSNLWGSPDGFLLVVTLRICQTTQSFNETSKHLSFSFFCSITAGTCQRFWHPPFQSLSTHIVQDFSTGVCVFPNNDSFLVPRKFLL